MAKRKRLTPAQKRRAREKAKKKKREKRSSEEGKNRRRRKKSKKESPEPQKKKSGWIFKIFTYSAGLLAVLVLGVYIFQGPLLNMGFQRARPIIIEFANKAGITIDEIDATELAISGTDTITFGSIKTVLTLPNKKKLDLNLEKSKAQLDFKLYNFILKGSLFEINISNPEKEDDKPLIFKGNKLRLESPIDKSNPQGSIQEIIKDFQLILEHGNTPLNVSLKGTLSMSYNDQNHDVAIKTKREEGLTYLQMEKESLLAIIGDSVEELTDAEVDVLADYPLRAATLLRIQKAAKKKAADLAVQPNFPEDAYRHVIWNFLLTNEFDEAFAKKVTDAHEIGAASNSEFDHKMDYNNNALGRKYALMGLKEPAIQQKVLTDPEIIRLTDE